MGLKLQICAYIYECLEATHCDLLFLVFFKPKLTHYLLLKKSGMLLLGFSNIPMDKTYQIFMVKYKEAHILQRSSQIKELYGRNDLLEIFIFSLLLFQLCGFLHLGTTPIILPCSFNPMDSTVQGILQARILEWVAVPFSKGIFRTQGLNPGLPHCGWILYQLSQ